MCALLDQRLRAAPGVRDVAFSNVLPMQGWGDGMPFLIAGRAFAVRANRLACFYKRVTSSYFRTLDIRQLRGRTLRAHDTKGGAPVTIINEEMAKRYFKGEDPIGKRILISRSSTVNRAWAPRSLGSSGHRRQRTDRQPGRQQNAGVDVTFDQSPTNDVNMVLSGALDPRMLTSAIQSAIHVVDKDQAVADLQTLEQIKTGTVSSDRMQTMHAGHLRRPGVVAGRHRDLRRHRLFGDPADPRTGHPRGSGRRPREPARYGDSPRRALDGHRTHHLALPAPWRSRGCWAACCSVFPRATR